MLGSETWNVEACSWDFRRSCRAQAWDCGEGASAVRLAAAVLGSAPRGVLCGTYSLLLAFKVALLSLPSRNDNYGF